MDSVLDVSVFWFVSRRSGLWHVHVRRALQASYCQLLCLKASHLQASVQSRRTLIVETIATHLYQMSWPPENPSRMKPSEWHHNPLDCRNGNGWVRKKISISGVLWFQHGGQLKSEIMLELHSLFSVYNLSGFVVRSATRKEKPPQAADTSASRRPPETVQPKDVMLCFSPSDSAFADFLKGHTFANTVINQ